MNSKGNHVNFASDLGWSGDEMMLDTVSEPGRPINLDYSRAKAYCACNRCGWGLSGHIFYRIILFCLLPLSGGPLSPKQSTNQPNASGPM